MRGWAFLSVISVPLLNALLFQLFWGLAVAVREHGISPSFPSANSGSDTIPRFLPFQSCHSWGPSPKLRYKSWPLCFHIHLATCKVCLGWRQLPSEHPRLWVTGSVGNTAVLVIAEQCTYNVRAFFLLLCPPSGQKAWREHNLHTWHWLAHRDIPWCIMSGIKAEKRAFLGGWGPLPLTCLWEVMSDYLCFFIPLSFAH